MAESLSAQASSIQSQVSAIQQADLQQKAAAATLSAAQQATDQLNNTVSAMCAPIMDALQKFKEVPNKLRSVVDVEGAAAGMYDTAFNTMQRAIQTLQSIVISVEVPITLEDYEADPFKYEKLMALEYKNNGITEDDCLSSGYTKIEQQLDPVWTQKLLDQFPAPEDRDVVSQQMEKVINGTIKTTYNAVKPAIQTVTSIASMGEVSEMVTAIGDSIDGIVKMASTSVPEDKLNQMLAEKQAAAEKSADEASSATSMLTSIGKSIVDTADSAITSAKNAVSSAASGIADGIQDAFKNIQAPELPDDIQHTLDDFKDALIMVKNNISNIYTVVILKMLKSVYECFDQIVGVIGVPSVPAPLGSIPQLVSDAQNIMSFVNGLPMSMTKCVESIMKRKVKAVQVGSTPIPPKPVQTLTPIPPTSKDVVKPDITWDDVLDKLINDYEFSESNAAKIIESLQDFYNGTDAPNSGTSSGQLIVGTKDSQPNEFNKTDYMPTFKYVSRYKLEAIEAYNSYIPNHISENSICESGDYGKYCIDVFSKSYTKYYWYEGREKHTVSYASDNSTYITDYVFSGLTEAEKAKQKKKQK